MAVTVKGKRAGKDQIANARAIIRVGQQMGAPPAVIQAALMTATQESTLRNLNHGDRDSRGLFQQRPSQGWGTPQQVTNPQYAARQFYQRAIPAYKKGTRDLTVLSQSVQRSAYPDAYRQWQREAGATMAALSGGGGGGGAPVPSAAPAAQAVGQTTGGFIDGGKLMKIMKREEKRVLAGQMPSKKFMPQIQALAQQAASSAQTIPQVQQVGAAAAEAGGGGSPSAQANALSDRFGLKITSARRSPEENARVGGSPTSAHLTGRGFDFGGDPAAMMRLARYAGKQGYGEVFYDPWGQWDNGQYRRQGIGGHSDHVHITF